MEKLLFFILITSSLFANSLDWHYDYNRALNKAKTDNKILIIDVYVNWSDWCKQMDEITYKDKLVVKEMKKHVLLKINPEENSVIGEYLFNKYKIDGYPNILFLNKKGRLIGRINRYIEPDELIKYVDKLKK